MYKNQYIVFVKISIKMNIMKIENIFLIFTKLVLVMSQCHKTQT